MKSEVYNDIIGNSYDLVYYLFIVTDHKMLYLIKLLSIIGIGLAVYLLYEQMFKPAWQPCYINSTVNCNAIISGEVAKTLGIPTPLFGLLGYIVILFAAIKTYKRLLFSMATFGLAFCLWIGYRELFELHVICPVCLGCQSIMIVVFTLAALAFRKKHI